MKSIFWLYLFLLPTFCCAEQNKSPSSTSKAQSTKPKKKSPAANSAIEFVKTRIAPNDTGYIESAFIQSQFRFRWDSGFDDRNIDLASYFYGAGLENQISKSNFQEYHFRGEYAFKKRFSVYLDAPIRRLAPTVSFACEPACGKSPVQTLIPTSNVSFTGLSDLYIGFKFGIINEPTRQLTFQLSSSLPSGDSSKGLGRGHATIEPYILYAQRLTSRINLFGELGDSHPTGSAPSFVYDPTQSATTHSLAGDVVNYGVGASYALRQDAQIHITPVLELVGWKVAGGLGTIIAPGPSGEPIAYVVPASTAPSFGSNIVNIKGGWRTSWGEHNSIYTGLGIQLSHAGWYHELLRIEYRYVFGKFP